MRFDRGYGCPETGETSADNQDVVALELHLPVDSIWTRELTAVSKPVWSEPSERYPGALPDRADVLVIGGGIAGTSLVHHLEKRRISTVLVERGHLASGASGRNAGFLLAGVADCYAEAVRIFGREKAREVWHITDENHDRMLEAIERDDVGHRRLGSATLASGEEEAARLEESAQLLRDDGFEAHWDGTRLLNPRDGEVNPPRDGGRARAPGQARCDPRRRRGHLDPTTR